MSASSSFDENKTKSLLEQLFGVDRCCTVYEEDEGFKLLADLSLCMYFGCGDGVDKEVPKVVSVANSEDFDGSDSISDIAEDRHCTASEATPDDELSRTIKRPDLPSALPETTIISLVHPPPPQPQSPPSPSNTPNSELHKIAHDPSRIYSHYERREALDDSDEENVPPKRSGHRGRSRQQKNSKDIPVVVYRRKKAKKHPPYPSDEYPLDEDPAVEHSNLVYSDEKSFGRQRRAYV